MQRLAIFAFALVMAACANAADAGDRDPVPSEPSLAVDWDDPERRVSFDDGWTIGACEGDGPFLCIERNGEAAGAVEAAAYPIASLSHLDPAAEDQDNLEAFAGEFHAVLGADRAAGCGADYQFRPIEPAPFTFTGRPGVVFGFSGALGDGTPSELNLQYATIVGDRVVTMVAAAYDEGGCPGKDDLISFDSAGLAEFRPHLEAVLRSSPLPDLPATPVGPQPEPETPPAPTTTSTTSSTTTTMPATTTTTTTVPAVDNSGADGSGCTPGAGALPDGRWYGLVKGVGAASIDFDLACWFSGEAAVRAARADGAESPPPNDYYVRNVNPALRTLAVGSGATVTWFRNVGDPTTETTTGYSEWQAAQAGRGAVPGVWVRVAGGVVTEIVEQYTP